MPQRKRTCVGGQEDTHTTWPLRPRSHELITVKAAGEQGVRGSDLGVCDSAAAAGARLRQGPEGGLQKWRTVRDFRHSAGSKTRRTPHPVSQRKCPSPGPRSCHVNSTQTLWGPSHGTEKAWRDPREERRVHARWEGMTAEEEFDLTGLRKGQLTSPTMGMRHHVHPNPFPAH